MLTTASETGQVNATAAEVYEEFFLPALFQEWPPRLLAAAGPREGQRVLDVACGTGVLARAAEPRVGRRGSVTGIDVNPGMLAVARRRAPGIDWRQGRAEALPFETAEFDAVFCQFGLMFFADRVAALCEMLRVLRPGGTLAVAVWDRLEHTPGYAAVVALLERLFGATIADALRAPFALGERQDLQALFAAAGAPDARIATHDGRARFASIDAWVHTDIKGWTLAGMIDDAQYALLRAEAGQALREFITAAGRVEFAAPAHIATCIKR